MLNESQTGEVPTRMERRTRNCPAAGCAHVQGQYPRVGVVMGNATDGAVCVMCLGAGLRAVLGLVSLILTSDHCRRDYLCFVEEEAEVQRGGCPDHTACKGQGEEGHRTPGPASVPPRPTRQRISNNNKCILTVSFTLTCRAPTMYVLGILPHALHSLSH